MATVPNRHAVVSVGPIPARVDAVKFLTNRFKGGLALKLVQKLLDTHGIYVTLVAWKHTEIPYEIERRCASVIRVADVFEYYDWMVSNAKSANAFVMSAAVAHLTPVKPWEGKFPSHLYKPGDEFDIRFMIAPRAIDAIKAINPRACLIGYKLFDAQSDEELVGIARHTLEDSKANVIFANTPAEAKTRKIALTQDGSVIPCTFDEHMDLVVRAIRQSYYATAVEPLTDEEAADPDVREALATVKSYEGSFEKYGTVAVAVANHPRMFATTSRGHKGEPVIVRYVDHGFRKVVSTGKATLNAPAMAKALEMSMAGDPSMSVVVHRHVVAEPMSEAPVPMPCAAPMPEGAKVVSIPSGAGRASFLVMDRPADYVFPGTVEEVEYVGKAMSDPRRFPAVYEPYHGYLKPCPVLPVDWSKYYEQFPDRYFSVPRLMAAVLEGIDPEADTLEIGGNAKSRAKYAYDPYVRSESSESVDLDTVLGSRYALGYAMNAVNYLDPGLLRKVIDRCGAFMANTFYEPPEESVRGREAAILDAGTGSIRHSLRLPDDGLVRHRFHAYRPEDWESLGLRILRYGRNSAIVYKNLPGLEGEG